MLKYPHLFFDLDHTLWDFNRNAECSLNELYNEFDLRSSIGSDFQEFYLRYIYNNNLLWSRYQNGFISSEDLKWKRMWRTLLDFKFADETLSRNLSERYLELLPTRKQVFPYTFEILDYLREKGYRLHLITNGFEKTQWTKIHNSGLSPYFEKVITSERSNSLKPKKEIFEFAVKEAGCGDAPCIMIGDNLEADIQGAINAGWDSVHVNHEKEAMQSHISATYHINCLSELKSLL